jgi:stage II sporulation protein D
MPSVASLDERKRPLKIQLNNNGQSKSVSGFTYWTEIGQKLGWDKVPGTRFSVSCEAASDRLIFRSTGAGHGVGLCQWGAKELAREGKTCEQILQFYFPGASIQSVK